MNGASYPIPDRFGYSVSLSADGSMVAVGAPRNNAGGTQRGHIRIYNWNGNDWVQFGDDIDGPSDNSLNLGSK